MKNRRRMLWEESKVQTPRDAEVSDGVLMRVRTLRTLAFLLIALHSLAWASTSHAAIFDRVVAFVDNRAITLSEFREQYERTKAVVPDISEEEVIETMVNRVLMVREARQYRIEASTEDAMINEFIDLKVRAFVTVAENEIETFYEKNKEQFAGRSFEEARAEIERYLTERELNAKLKAMLADLRKKAYIKIQLTPGE